MVVLVGGLRSVINKQQKGCKNFSGISLVKSPVKEDQNLKGFRINGTKEKQTSKQNFGFQRKDVVLLVTPSLPFTYLSSSGFTVVKVAQVENSQNQVGKIQVFV